MSALNNKQFEMICYCLQYSWHRSTVRCPTPSTFNH